MEDIAIAFYKGKGKFIDKLIRWATGSMISHSAIVMRGVCFEADAWKGKVVKRPWEYNPANWELVTCTVTNPDEIWKFCVSTVGDRYDYLGAVGVVFPHRPQVSRKWYCSEHVATALGFQQTAVTPGDLYYLISCRKK